MASSDVNNADTSAENKEDRIVGLLMNTYETQFFGFTPKAFSDGSELLSLFNLYIF
jgi:hypothetical protein